MKKCLRHHSKCLIAVSFEMFDCGTNISDILSDPPVQFVLISAQITKCEKCWHHNRTFHMSQLNEEQRTNVKMWHHVIDSAQIKFMSYAYYIRYLHITTYPTTEIHSTAYYTVTSSNEWALSLANR